MADAVTSRTIFSGKKRLVMQFTNISDGTGESAVVKIDRSTLSSQLGVEPSKIAIEAVQWAIQGFTSVRVLFDHTTDDVGLVLPTGSGIKDFTYGGDLADPASTGGTGDILFTTAGAVSGATYDILLFVRLYA